MKLWGQAGRGQGVTSLHFAYPFPRFTLPSTTSFHSLSLHPAPAYLLRYPACQPPRAVKPRFQLSLPQLFRPSSFLHKITEAAERKCGGGVVSSLLAQLVGPAVAGAQLAAPCPFTQSGGRSSSPVLMASSLRRLEL